MIEIDDRAGRPSARDGADRLTSKPDRRAAFARRHGGSHNPIGSHGAERDSLVGTPGPARVDDHARLVGREDSDAGGAKSPDERIGNALEGRLVVGGALRGLEQLPEVGDGAVEHRDMGWMFAVRAARRFDLPSEQRRQRTMQRRPEVCFEPFGFLGAARLLRLPRAQAAMFTRSGGVLMRGKPCRPQPERSERQMARGRRRQTLDRRLTRAVEVSYRGANERHRSRSDGGIAAGPRCCRALERPGCGVAGAFRRTGRQADARRERPRACRSSVRE